MQLDGLLFDFGGTLDGPGDPWGERFRRAYARHLPEVSRDLLMDAFGYSTRRSYADPESRDRGLVATVAHHVDWQFEHLGRTDRATATVIVGEFVAETRRNLAASRALLMGWARRLRLGVVSNFYGNVRVLLAEADIEPLLTAIVDSTLVGVAKPDARIFAIALERLDCPAARTLFVGDSWDKDIVGARAAGLRTAWLAGSDRATATAAVDVVLRGLDELEGIVSCAVRSSQPA